MNAVSYDIKDMLEAESSLGLTFATNLFVAYEPASPDNCVTIFDTPSFAPDMTLDPQNEAYYRSSAQIRIRHNTYGTGMSWARDIMDSLHGRAHETWNGTLYTVVMAAGEPALLATDENNRKIIIINFNLQRR